MSRAARRRRNVEPAAARNVVHDASRPLSPLPPARGDKRLSQVREARRYRSAVTRPRTQLDAKNRKYVWITSRRQYSWISASRPASHRSWTWEPSIVALARKPDRSQEQVEPAAYAIGAEVGDELLEVEVLAELIAAPVGRVALRSSSAPRTRSAAPAARAPADRTAVR